MSSTSLVAVDFLDEIVYFGPSFPLSGRVYYPGPGVAVPAIFSRWACVRVNAGDFFYV